MLNSLGMLYTKQHQYAEAETVLLRSLETRRLHLEPTDPSIAQSCVSLGNLMLDMERNEEALNHLKAGLASYREGLGADHPKVAWAHEGIARVLMKIGLLAEAKEHLDAALRIRDAIPHFVQL